MNWIDALDKAAERADGGEASFPPSFNSGVARGLGYGFPNENINKLFLRRPNTPALMPQDDCLRSRRSAGWLVPEPQGELQCNPLFIAHSMLSAIWLLRQTLGPNSVSSGAWEELVTAAHRSAAGISVATVAQPISEQAKTPPADENYGTDIDDVPPSGQVPHCPENAGPGKRARSATADSPTPKRLRAAAGDVDLLVRVMTPLVEDDDLQREPQDDDERDDEEQEGELQEAEEAIDEEADGTVAAGGVMTVTSNNNRRATLKLQKKLEASRSKKRLSLGLREPDEKAPLQERAAYSSIPAKDESTIAWIIKQKLSTNADFYSASPTPYYTAITVLEKARVLGNRSSRFCARQFLQAWREQGTPFRAGTEERQLVPATQAVPSTQLSLADARSQVARSKPDDAFRFAWGMCTRYEAALAAVHIGSRWALALLGEAYSQKIREIREGDSVASNDRSRNRYGKGPVRTEAIAGLISLVYPSPTKRDHEVFRNRLKQAARWHTIVRGLGWGSLLLLPPEDVSNWWVERGLRVGQLEVFIELVKRERPDLCSASQALERWLGPEGIAGGPIAGKQMLSIEAEAPATMYEVEEVDDSDDDRGLLLEHESDDGSDTAELSQPKRWRHLTLTELFQPCL